jgi:Arc/MetJ-type ribon-helix-helix transcriptional regulator
MNILLTPEQVQRIQKHLEIGKYANVNEIIDESLKRLEAREDKPQRGKKILEIFEETGFLDSLPDADPQLSSNYKEIVRAEIGSTHDSR